MRNIGKISRILAILLIVATGFPGHLGASLAEPGDDVKVTLSDGSPEASLVFETAGAKTVSLRIPSGWVAPSVSIDLEGEGYTAGRVDQRNDATSYKGMFSVRAQQFRTGTRSLAGVEIFMARTTRGSNGFTVEIRPDDGMGLPSASVMTSVTRDVAIGAYRWERFDFSAIPVEPGLPYWIVAYVVNPDKVSYPSQPSLGDYGYFIGLSSGDEYPEGGSADLLSTPTGLRWERPPTRKTWDLMFKTIDSSEYFPTNPALRLGSDGEVEWQRQGEFNGPKATADLTAPISKYLLLNTTKVGAGDTDIAIAVSSDSPGVIHLSGIKIVKAPPIPTPRPVSTPALRSTPTGQVTASATPLPAMTGSPTPAPAPSVTSSGMPPQFIPPTDIAFKSLGYGDSTVFGVFASLDVFLPGAGGYALAEGGYLKLILSHAGILLVDRSTMIVRMNDVPLATVRLNADNTNRTELKVGLPKDKLLDTLNHLRLEFYMRIAEDPCTDELNNPALNATIYGESTIHYEYASLVRKPLAPIPTLADYPKPFVYPSYSWPDELLFVVPDNPSEAELTSASSIAAKLGQMAKGKIITATLTTASRLDRATREGSNLFFVGKAQSLALPQELRQKASLDLTEDSAGGETTLRMGGTLLSPDSGAISLVGSPWSPQYYVLIATGATDHAVRRAGTALSTRTYLDTLKGSQAVITQEPRPSAILADDDAGLPKEATLSQLGVSDIRVTGLGEVKSPSIFFSSPATNSTEDAYIDLVIGHSPLLVASESSLRVDLNGTSIRSIRLDDSNTGPTKVRVLLPQTIVRPGANSLSFRLTLFSQLIETCGSVDKSRAWVVIHSQSVIHLPPTGPEPPLNLALFPYPFMGTGPHLESAYLERNALVLPDDPGEWRDFLQLATALGSYATADTLSLPSMTVSAMPEEIRQERNIIAYGTWGANTLAGSTEASLPLQLTSDQGKTFSLPAQATISVRDTEPIAMVETIPSPWNTEKAMLIVSGTSLDTLPWVSTALAKGVARGNLSTVTRGDQINTFSLGTPALSPRPSGPGLSLPSIGAIAIGFLIFSCIAAIALEPLFKKRKESREAP